MPVPLDQVEGGNECVPEVIHEVIHPGKRVGVELDHLTESLEVFTDLETSVWLEDHSYGVQLGADRLLDDFIPLHSIYFLF